MWFRDVWTQFSLLSKLKKKNFLLNVGPLPFLWTPFEKSSLQSYHIPQKRYLPLRRFHSISRVCMTNWTTVKMSNKRAHETRAGHVSQQKRAYQIRLPVLEMWRVPQQEASMIRSQPVFFEPVPITMWLRLCSWMAKTNPQEQIGSSARGPLYTLIHQQDNEVEALNRSYISISGGLISCWISLDWWCFCWVINRSNRPQCSGWYRRIFYLCCLVFLWC